jgi:catechol 2,3-dioxygenase-like lactoylglutathione lyase family enzyme
MYDHLGIHVTDLSRAIRFYQAALAPLGYVLDCEGEAYAGLGPKGAPALWLYAADKSRASHAHIALRAADHKQVQGFYKSGLEAGGKDNGGPGPRKDYSPTYYAAFLIDPDGNNVEAVCT